MPSLSLDPRLADPDFLRIVGRGMLHREAVGRQLSPELQVLHDACRWDLGLFAKTFVPHWTPDAYNQVHRDYYTRYAQRQGSRGHHDVTAAPREHSKTTGCCLVSMLHSAVYKTERFTLYITNRDRDAIGKVSDVRRQLESNAHLLQVYGPQVGSHWNAGDYTTLHNQRFRGASRNTQLRGSSDDAQRPTRILGDDVEHFLRVLSEEQRERTWDWLTKDILHLGDATTSYEFWGTILHEQAMLKRLLTTPGWEPHFYQAVEQFADPSSIPLWQEWRGKYIALDNPDREAEAHAFFEAHEEEMLAGHKVLWPERKPYIELMKSRLREGESSYWQELMNMPLGDSRYIFDLEQAAYVTVQPNGIVRGGGKLIPWTDIVQVGAFWDPVSDKKDIKGTDYASCPIVAQDRDGYLYVLDCYIEQQTSTDAQMNAIVDLCWRWDCTLIGIEGNGFQGVLPGLLREKLAARALAEGQPDFQGTLVAIVNTRNKVQRIKTLEPLLSNHWLQMAKGLPAEFYRQFRDFLPINDAGKDDAPDSVEGAIRVVKGLYERRDVV